MKAIEILNDFLETRKEIFGEYDEDIQEAIAELELRDLYG